MFMCMGGWVGGCVHMHVGGCWRCMYYISRRASAPTSTHQSPQGAGEGGPIGMTQPVIDGVRLPSQIMRLTRERELEEELALAEAIKSRRSRGGRQEL